MSSTHATTDLPRRVSDNGATLGPVLVVGGCGFLGSHIVDALVEDSFDVVAASRKPRRYLNPAARYIALDIHDVSATANLIDEIKPCAIIHSATAGPMASKAAHASDYSAMENLLQICYSSQHVSAFVYTSTALVVANSNGLHRISETEAILYDSSSAPNNYSRFKVLSEALTLSFDKPGCSASSQDFVNTLRTVSLRLPGIYGPRDGLITPGLLQGATFVSRLQFGDNKSKNEWIYVQNAASAHVLALKALLQDGATGIGGEVFFVADNNPLEFWDFARKLWAAAGDENALRSENRIIIPWAPIVALAIMVEIFTFVFTFGFVEPPMSRHHLHYMRFGAWWDISKARERLHYKPIVSTDEGIARTVAWFQQNQK